MRWCSGLSDSYGEYFAGQRREFALPLDLPQLEPVTEAVLRALRTVGYGRDDHVTANWPS